MPAEIQFVKTGSKLRVRIAYHIDSRGVRRAGVYNNDWNCQFPNHLRAENKRYLVPDENVVLRSSKSGKHFYHINTRCGLEEITNQNETVPEDGALDSTQANEMKVMPNKVFETSPECVVCMSTESDVVFSPCGHLCSCEPCGKQLTKCCICRTSIVVIIKK